jgi:hypothetical protein
LTSIDSLSLAPPYLSSIGTKLPKELERHRRIAEALTVHLDGAFTGPQSAEHAIAKSANSVITNKISMLIASARRIDKFHLILKNAEVGLLTHN